MYRYTARRCMIVVGAIYALMWCLTNRTSSPRSSNAEASDVEKPEITSTIGYTEAATPMPIYVHHDGGKIQMTNVYQTHRNSDPFQNALKYGVRRQQRGFLTIGIPTMKRPSKQAYLWQTLHSLLNNSNEAEKNDTVIVIFLSDFGRASKRQLSTEIIQKYGYYLETGLIQIIEAPRDFYPSLKSLKRTYNHPMKQVVWRSKQNMDYAFMMHYCLNISQYYLQLEDDVTTVPNYFSIIKESIRTQRGGWVCLEFSHLGYIGKLYRSEDLEKLANLLMIFYNEQPNDVTYLYFNQLMLQWSRRIIIPTIFQHHGYHSTLLIKKSDIQDKYFRNVAKS